jgi:hypothetical protein
MSTYATVQHNEVIVREQQQVSAKRVIVQTKPAPVVRVSAKQLEREREERAREQARERAAEQARAKELARERELALHRRPVIVSHPVIYQPPVNVGTYTTNYTYAPQAQPFVIATHAALGQRLDVDTTSKLAGLSNLEIDAVGSGTTAISQITVYYASGAYQLYNVNTVIGGQNGQAFRLALGDGTDVVRVIIDGHSGWDAALNVSVRC